MVRAVLDRCDEVLDGVRDASLLKTMFGPSGSEGVPDDPRWRRPAVYALECALAALWSSVGVRPSVTFGHAVGALASAQAAGVFGLEDGLLLAAALDDPYLMPEGIAMNPPMLTPVSGVSNRAVPSDEVLDAEYRCRQAGSGPGSFEMCVESLAALDVGVLVEVGLDAELGRSGRAAWPTGDGNAAPVALSSRGPAVVGGTPATGSIRSFLEAVAGAYEAGHPVSFAGPFAGESRRRIALPGHPFERRRHWIKIRERQAATPI